MSVVGRQWQLAIDPSVAGFDANVGECAVNTLTGTRYVKTGAATTAWTVDTSAYGGGGPPTAHATTHQPGGTDPLAVDAAAATGSLRTIGTGAAQACGGTDSRLSDARTPVAHASTHNAGGADVLAIDAAAATGSLRTLGTGAAQACAGNDARLSNQLPTWTDFTQSLGVSRRSGTFDITGLSGLTTGKNVAIVQTAQQIASKGNARDEGEMDRIDLSGYVLSATTIRAYWRATGVVVGIYAFAFQIGA